MNSPLTSIPGKEKSLSVQIVSQISLFFNLYLDDVQFETEVIQFGSGYEKNVFSILL